MPETAVAIRHVAFEDLGSFAGALVERGYTVRYLEATGGFRGLDPLAPDLLVVLGGPIGAGDDDGYWFLRQEVDLLARRLAADRPTLGICLGAQLIARALGARVHPARAREIGWGPIRLTGAGRRSCLAALAPEHTRVLHWHGDTFDLPEGAVLLASTDACANQAFAYGNGCLALQFHPEVTARGLERWFVGHAHEIAATPGVSVAGLRADTRRFAAALETRGVTCLEAWLEELAAPPRFAPQPTD